MNAAAGTREVPIASYLALAAYLCRAARQLTPAEAVAQAIDQWVDTAQRAAAPLRGYQWKCLFLPETTKLRMHVDGQNFYADVVGDAILYQGRSVSPRQLTVAIAGDGRNAWRDLWLRLPGEKNWTSAARRRQALEQDAAPKTLSPAEAMAAAAKCMSDTLRAALALVDHAGALSAPQAERRVARHRRAKDLLIDDCRRD